MEIIKRLIFEKCFHIDRLAVFPEWLTGKDLEKLVNDGMLRKETYPDLYNHTEYFLGGEFYKILESSIKV